MEVQQASARETPWDQAERGRSGAILRGLLRSAILCRSSLAQLCPRREAVNEQLKAQRRSLMRKSSAILLRDPSKSRREPDRLLRLQLLGALNWVPVWYNAGQKMSPRRDREAFVRSIRKEGQD